MSNDKPKRRLCHKYFMSNLNFSFKSTTKPHKNNKKQRQSQ